MEGLPGAKEIDEPAGVRESSGRRLAGLRRHWRTALGAGVGASLGALYARFVGCGTGTCFITSHVSTAALFFGVTGAVVGLPGPRSGRPPEGGESA